jgi:hypothetical protein
MKTINKIYKMPDDINPGQLACENCKYNGSCEEINGSCAANCLFNNQICHYKSCIMTEQNKNIQKIDVHSIDDVIGKKIIEVTGGRVGDESFTLMFEDGTGITFCHDQDCCEHVSIDDVEGDIKGMAGQTLLKCSYTTSVNEDPQSDWDDSWTWTFYHFATCNGYVDMKWYGTSNGCYSERVDVKLYDEYGELIKEY